MTKQKQRYLDAAKKFSVGNDQLFQNLGEELFTCPASTMSSLHYAYDGGLVDHLLKVASYAVRIASTLPEAYRPSLESVMRVSLLSEIGKVGAYTPCTSDWHRKNQGKMYEFVEGKVSLRVGQRSVYQLWNAGVSLSEAEYQAILAHDANTAEDAMIKWHAEPLTVVLRQAIELAIIDEKFEQKNG